MQTLRFAFRMLMKNPGVTIVAVITLALGIGANTAIFSVINGVLLSPLRYKNPDRLVSLWENVPGHGRWRAAPANFFDWKKQNTVFEDVAAFGGSVMTLTNAGEPAQLSGTRVSAGYFEVVGVEPIRGRKFLNEEYEAGKGQVVILGYGFWNRRLGANESIINNAITLDGQPYQVVGVMGPGLYPVRPTTSGHIEFGEAQQDYWLPMSFTADWAGVRSAHVLGVLGRLKPAVTLQQATAEMNTIGARLEQQYPANKGEGIIVSAFMNEMVGDVKPALIILMVAVGVVLLIACANIAGLLLAQHAARGKEIAIRAALGANRVNLVSQFFVEGLLLSLLGAVAGIGLASVGVNVLLKLIPQDIPRLDLVKIDWRVLSFTLLLSLITCLVFALIPAWNASKPDLHSTLEQSGRTSGPGASSLRFRQFLVVSQVSMAVILVVGAGLLIKSFWLLRKVDPGFKPQRVLSVGVTLPNRYNKPEEINRFFDQLHVAVSNLPGVQSTAIAYDHPLTANWGESFEIEGQVLAPDARRPNANFNPIGPDYFSTMGMQLVSGRAFNQQDDHNHPSVAIINETFVRAHFPNENPLGRKIRVSQPARVWRDQNLVWFEIVGVVRDVKSSGLQAATEPTSAAAIK